MESGYFFIFFIYILYLLNVPIVCIRHCIYQAVKDISVSMVLLKMPFLSCRFFRRVLSEEVTRAVADRTVQYPG